MQRDNHLDTKLHYIIGIGKMTGLLCQMQSCFPPDYSFCIPSYKAMSGKLTLLHLGHGRISLLRIKLLGNALLRMEISLYRHII